VRKEIRNTWAVCSAVSPPKNRDSTTRLARIELLEFFHRFVEHYEIA
jgi:hypothetical protein